MIRYLIILSVILNGCATPYERRKAELAASQDTLFTAPGFSFAHGSSEYYFSPQHFKQKGRECLLYLGYQDGRLTYAFDSAIFRQIEKVYGENQSPDVIKSLLLKTIESHRNLERKCFEVGQGSPPDAGQGTLFLILLWPITVSLLAYQVTDDHLLKRKISQTSRELKLGRRKEDLPGSIKDKLIPMKKGKLDYFVYENGKLRTLLYFERDRLDAWSQILTP